MFSRNRELVFKKIFAVVGTCALTCAAWALTLSADDEAPRGVALQWLRVVDSGNYEDAALMISGYARGSQDWVNYFATRRSVLATLGRLNKREILEIKHAAVVPGDSQVRDHAIIRFNSVFERRAAALEEVVLVKIGCCWEVGDYSIVAINR